MIKFKTYTLVAVLFVLFLYTLSARAEDSNVISVTIENHKFTPSDIHIPANTKVTIEIENKDNSTEEFDSSALQIEKVVTGGHKAIIHMPPLDVGRYPFMGEYHANTAQGVVIVE